MHKFSSLASLKNHDDAPVQVVPRSLEEDRLPSVSETVSAVLLLPTSPPHSITTNPKLLAILVQFRIGYCHALPIQRGSTTTSSVKM